MDYIKKMKKRDPELSEGWGQIVTSSVQTRRRSPTGELAPRRRYVPIIQSSTSWKAEPFKYDGAGTLTVLELGMVIRKPSIQQKAMADGAIWGIRIIRTDTSVWC